MTPDPEVGAPPSGRLPEPAATAFVVTSEVTIPPANAEQLESAFSARLGEVDHFPGFQRLEVWRDTVRAGTYLMVSWWDSRADFTAYMRSDQHRRSHARIPTDPVRPRGTGVQRFERVSS